jgi:hypothetical protein
MSRLRDNTLDIWIADPFQSHREATVDALVYLFQPERADEWGIPDYYTDDDFDAVVGFVTERTAIAREILGVRNPYREAFGYDN